VKIEVALYATLSQYLPKGSQGHKATIECADKMTVEQVIDQLGIPKPHHTMVLVNGIYVEPGTLLKESDLLALFPPLAGGRDPSLNTNKVRRRGIITVRSVSLTELIVGAFEPSLGDPENS
jgi:sulfur carrier protein ThiS